MIDGKIWQEFEKRPPITYDKTKDFPLQEARWRLDFDRVLGEAEKDLFDFQPLCLPVDDKTELEYYKLFYENMLCKLRKWFDDSPICNKQSSDE